MCELGGMGGGVRFWGRAPPTHTQSGYYTCNSTDILLTFAIALLSATLTPGASKIDTGCVIL